MAWNGPIGGTDYSTCDFTKAPWVSGIAELTHEEVLFVIEACSEIEVGHETDDFYIQSRYNELTGYEKAINGETYFCIKGYNPEINTLGIDANGIILTEEQQQLKQQAEQEALLAEGESVPEEV